MPLQHLDFKNQFNPDFSRRSTRLRREQIRPRISTVHNYSLDLAGRQQPLNHRLDFPRPVLQFRPPPAVAIY
jgi:hypothetical protein